ncbi:MAG: peptidase M61 [Bernardetiaceae bacterium]|nr:peptidase M61 [Bernardetiaceae bacterium]
MKKIQNCTFFLLLLTCFFPALAQHNAYHFHVNLNEAEGHTLPVSLLVPTISQDTISYFMPKIVPGTYSIYDFGRFLSDFEATDKEGQPLEVKRMNDNEWQIYNAKNLYKIRYIVEDTYHTRKGNKIFEPAGTNIEPGKNFIINQHGFFGYFEGMKRLPYTLEFVKPETFFGSTSLKRQDNDDAQKDIFTVENYNDLVDAPLMYCKPDTMVFEVGGAEILVSVYSPNSIVGAKFLGDKIRKTLEAQKNYLGGTLPIDNYAFILYLFRGRSGSGSYGALEHSYSSFYYLPEIPGEFLAQSVIEIAAHEFFHIVTPLNIHSEEIHYFDFNDPKMSKHLWLYEGVVEYFAHHMQVSEAMIELPEFLNTMKDKIIAASRYRQDLSFTEMSLGCLTEHKKQYNNVYDKGALIGLCLDLQLRISSKGERGLRDLIMELSEKYGKDKPFKDEELFDEIEAMTYPEIGEFFKKYVAGTEPLPIGELFEQIGIYYSATGKSPKVSFGNFEYDVTEEGIVVTDVSELDDFGKSLEMQVGDILTHLNKEKITPENISQILQKYHSQTREGDNIDLVVLRENKRGKYKKRKLRASAKMTRLIPKHGFKILDNATDEQKALRKAWLMQ